MRKDILRQDDVVKVLHHLFSEENPEDIIKNLSKKELEYYRLILDIPCSDALTQKIFVKYCIEKGYSETRAKSTLKSLEDKQLILKFRFNGNLYIVPRVFFSKDEILSGLGLYEIRKIYNYDVSKIVQWLEKKGVSILNMKQQLRYKFSNAESCGLLKITENDNYKELMKIREKSGFCVNFNSQENSGLQGENFENGSVARLNSGREKSGFNPGKVRSSGKVRFCIPSANPHVYRANFENDPQTLINTGREKSGFDSKNEEKMYKFVTFENFIWDLDSGKIMLDDVVKNWGPIRLLAQYSSGFAGDAAMLFETGGIDEYIVSVSSEYPYLRRLIYNIYLYILYKARRGIVKGEGRMNFGVIPESQLWCFEILDEVKNLISEIKNLYPENLIDPQSSDLKFIFTETTNLLLSDKLNLKSINLIMQKKQNSNLQLPVLVEDFFNLKNLKEIIQQARLL